MDQATELPLAHRLYAGARSDMKTFAAFLQLLRERLRALAGRADPWTLVCDAGASSQKNLESLEPVPDDDVTSVRPSSHRALLAEGAEHLAEVTFSQTPESSMTTAPGSPNEALWSEFVDLGWMIRKDDDLELPGGARFPMRIYSMSPEGLQPILNLLAALAKR